jgi:DNA (cytosine-5)-methyltransferase 1
MMHLFPYKWYLKDGYPSKNIDKNNYNVFGTFICGGGSTMGYKLAGFNHLGGVEIDPPIADIYKTNHNPKYLFNEDIRDFNNRTDLPTELYSLDLLDGSPPCSTFSMAGSREKGWGKEKVFREGQTKQTLDDLVFVYCDTIIKLQPKVFLLENVKGIIQGNAKLYSKQIVDKMNKAGYAVQVFCLNAASMGVPQKRERVFFIGHKKEFDLPKLKMEFKEDAIPFGLIEDINDNSEDNQKQQRELWNNQTEKDKSLNDISIRINNKNNFFSHVLLNQKNVMPTITAHSSEQHWLKHKPRHPNKKEIILAGTYPLDYDFKDVVAGYLIGMSVPPVMTAQIANQIKIQWLDKIK